jgi:hypothetical protein
VAYRSLDAGRIVDTARALERRIGERFPDSGLRQVAAELVAVAEETIARVEDLRRPRWGLRAANALLITLILAAALLALSTLRPPSSITDLGAFVQVLESAINDAVFVGIAIVFLFTVEGRLRRRQALKGLHELRSMVHIVDMHQLTKDPDRDFTRRADTASSPRRGLTPFELTRYLDYCSELLSVASKVGALYAQHVEDPVVLAAVSEVETLATGLSSKIWQKLVILGTAARARTPEEAGGPLD